MIKPELNAQLAHLASARQLALSEVAERITQIKELLSEINQITKQSGIPVSLGELVDLASEIDSDVSEVWNSSNCY